MVINKGIILLRFGGVAGVLAILYLLWLGVAEHGTGWLSWAVTILAAGVGLYMSGALERVRVESMAAGRFANTMAALATPRLASRLETDGFARLVVSFLFGFVVATADWTLGAAFTDIPDAFWRAVLPLAIVGSVAWFLVGVITRPAVSGGFVGSVLVGLAKDMQLDKVAASIVEPLNLEPHPGSRYARAAVGAVVRTATTIVARAVVLAVLPVLANGFLGAAVALMVVGGVAIGPELVAYSRIVLARSASSANDAPGAVHVVEDKTSGPVERVVLDGTGTNDEEPPDAD